MKLLSTEPSVVARSASRSGLIATEIAFVPVEPVFFAPEEIPLTILFTETSKIARRAIAPTIMKEIRIRVDQSCQAS
jgi:hypothetical protein